MCTTIHVQYLPRYLTGLGEIEHGLGDILDINYGSKRRQRL
jgi:hypothetical protein